MCIDNNTIIIIIDIILLVVVGLPDFVTMTLDNAIYLLTLLLLSFFLLPYFNCRSWIFIGIYVLFPVLFHVRLTPCRLTPAGLLSKVAVGSINVYYVSSSLYLLGALAVCKLHVIIQKKENKKKNIRDNKYVVVFKYKREIKNIAFKIQYKLNKLQRSSDLNVRF